MALAIALVLIVVAAVLFHVMSPWWLTPLASNWGQIDFTLAITIVITGVVFIVINLFVAYAVIRYRHRSGLRAAYQPENKKLESWLIGITTVGIVAMLAPGLLVYAKLINPPDDALVLEVVGQQWQWSFRFPGKDGQLGSSGVEHINAGNPFGLNPLDPRGQDDVLVQGNEVHLPLGRPVKVLLRSKDVLHDFYVQPFRARMNLVPGMVTHFWFTPTKVGRFEILCAQLCGVGHYNMRGMVVVEDEATFQRWLASQPTFRQTMTTTAATGGEALVKQGAMLAQSQGCFACHSTDGSARVGPTWKGLYGKTETFSDGTTAKVDVAYLHHFIRNPTAKVPKGYPPIMPKFDLSDQQLAALVAYIESLGQGKDAVAQK
ncbi:cytochrome c oxidase subunit II [Crenobacter sp. SG2305]|uniref:cytochrome c oxidase subunit II n=1 Tax=Crenobacter oryzisoli TaxID=3056844 RepID=UPI0025AB3EE4|nr:cytochrome c oxidase subunit II [Crenobacter sp. SG2305]MDN0082818.1 cytochrome c oxidase subunit II [Crenobacter sp. SG2305]